MALQQKAKLQQVLMHHLVCVTGFREE